jgi:hypothetical protein
MKCVWKVLAAVFLTIGTALIYAGFEEGLFSYVLLGLGFYAGGVIIATEE